jgi:hypothetical protein
MTSSTGVAEAGSDMITPGIASALPATFAKALVTGATAAHTGHTGATWPGGGGTLSVDGGGTLEFNAAIWVPGAAGSESAATTFESDVTSLVTAASLLSSLASVPTMSAFASETIGCSCGFPSA